MQTKVVKYGFTNPSKQLFAMNVNEVNQQIRELEELRRQTRRFRLLTLAALLAIVITGVSAIINSVYGLALAGPKQDVFMKQLGASLHRDLLPVAQKIAGSSLQRLQPAVEAELQKLNARSPEIAEVTLRELNQMGVELPVRAEKILDETVGHMLHQREARLRQMFPGLYDAKVATLLDNLNLETQDQLARTGEKVFGPHLNSIQNIMASLEKIRTSESVDRKKDVDSWQMAFLFLDVFVHEFEDLTPVKVAQLKETKP
jgi:hypothetical protein